MVHRPIQMSAWFPAKRGLTKIKNVAYIKHFDNGIMPEYPDEATMKSNLKVFKERYMKWGSPEERIEEFLNSETGTYLKGKTAQDRPLVLYGPSFNSRPFENIKLIEYLASHGFVVISSPCVGPNSRRMEMSAEGAEAQMKDMLFLLNYALNEFMAEIDENRIAASGFSWGGGSAVLAQMNDPRIKAVVDIDGSLRTPRMFDAIRNSEYYDLEKASAPYVFYESKLPLPKYWTDLPDSTFIHFNSLKIDKYHLKFPKLRHIKFMSLNVDLLPNNPNMNEQSQDDIIDSYEHMSNHLLLFLNRFLNDQRENENQLSVSKDETLYLIR